MQYLHQKTDKKKVYNFFGENIRGFVFSFSRTLQDLQFNNLDVKFAGAKVKIQRMVDGQPVQTVFNDTLHALISYVYASNKPFMERTFLSVRPIDGLDFYQLPVDLGTCFKLDNVHSFAVTIENSSIPFDCYIDSIQAIGLQEFDTIIEVKQFDPTQSKEILKLGNDVASVTFFETEFRGTSIKNADITSDKVNQDLTAQAIYQKLDNTIEPDADYTGAPIMILNCRTIPLNNVTIDLECYDAFASRYLIIERRIITAEILNNFASKSLEHRTENVRHIKKS